jgi:peptide/nickel transport system ATP-binding protein
MILWKQIAESMIIHRDSSWSEAKRQAISLLERFKVLPADQWADAYPVSYSGGMLQRAMVAMGTSVNPDVIIADEPTKGVDLLNKSGITDLFLEMKNRGITQILITHDLDFARELADG